MSSPPSIRLIPATKADLDALVALGTAAGRDDPVATASAMARLREEFLAEGTSFIDVYGKRVGLVATRREGGDLRLLHLYVDPAYQHQGIGAAVLNRVCALAATKDAAVRLRLPSNSWARRFFQREGFDYVADDGAYIDYVRQPQH